MCLPTVVIDFRVETLHFLFVFESAVFFFSTSLSSNIVHVSVCELAPVAMQEEYKLSCTRVKRSNFECCFWKPSEKYDTRGEVCEKLEHFQNTNLLKHYRKVLLE